MRSIVRDYSRIGDLVCDPLAGTGATLRAAEDENRRAIGSELCSKTAGEGALVGNWRDVLRHVGKVDALITDAPFSARTHDAAVRVGERADGYSTKGHSASYAAWSRDDVFDFVGAWSPRTRGWICAITDFTLAPVWHAAFESVGRCAFAPVPIVLRGMSVRLRGDGPSSWALYLMVARPKALRTWGTLPGAYLGTDAARID